MNKRQRVLSAMDNQPVDRPPVGFWFHFPEEQHHGDACVQAHLDYYNAIDVDMAKIMCDGYFDYPNPVAKAVVDAKDWYQLQPLGPDAPYIREQIKRAKAVKAGIRDDMVILYNVFAPFSSIRFGTSDDLVMRHLREEPEAILYALDIIAKDNALLSELLVTQAGVDGIYCCMQGGEKDRFTPDAYRRWIGPSDLAVLEHANQFSETNVLHCCGWAGIPNHLEVWQDYPAKVFNWACFIEDVDLAEGKRLFGDKAVLGGFDNRPQGVLFSGTQEEVTRATRALIESAGTRGVLIGADCTLPADIDTRRIGWVVDAVKSI